MCFRRDIKIRKQKAWCTRFWGTWSCSLALFFLSALAAFGAGFDGAGAAGSSSEANKSKSSSSLPA